MLRVPSSIHRSVVSFVTMLLLMIGAADPVLADGNCPLLPPSDQTDSDGDAVGDVCDNCVADWNALQRDTNADGYGNICDPDFNGNGVVDPFDFSLLKSRFGQPNFPDQDLNGNGIVDPFDFSKLKAAFGQPPGPTGMTPKSVNNPPFANAGSDQSVADGATVQLSGLGSFDPDGDSLQYGWTFVSLPAGSSAALSAAWVAEPTFAADVPGDYVLELRVGDGTVVGFPNQVTISAGDPTGVASIELISSSPQLPSDHAGIDTVLLTAIARDASNAAVEGVTVVFDTGGDPFASLQIASPVTNVAGVVTADLSNGFAGAMNRTITLTATDPQSGASDSIFVSVVGTTLTISGPASLAQNDTADFSVVLTDSKGAGIPSEQVTVTSATGNTISAPSLITDATGKITFTLTATAGGADTVTVSAFGEMTTQIVNVSSEQFALTNSSAPVTDIPLAPVTETIMLTWTVGGAEQVGQTINLAATRGTLSSPTAVTNGAGQASVTISSMTAGPSAITASNSSGTNTTLQLEFVATNPTQISLQADPLTVAPGGTSEITAVVRDPQGNLVKNQVVNFQILADDTNGFLAAAAAITDSQGRATTIYTGGAVPGAEDGVQISATVASAPAVTATVSLTVAQSEFDFIIGTGNDIFSPTTATHAQEWNVIVTDSLGSPVQNTPVQVSLRSLFYYKSQLVLTPTAWVIPTFGPLGPPVQCVDEDVNRNGILDLVNGEIGTGEDLNGSGQIEAGNVATVAPVLPGAPPGDPCTTAGAGGTSAEVVTNSQGIARVCVIWPQNFSLWVDAQIEAMAGVSGSESSQAQVFRLPALASDLQNISAAPPSQFSPFGTELDCTIPPPGLPLP